MYHQRNGNLLNQVSLVLKCFKKIEIERKLNDLFRIHKNILADELSAEEKMNSFMTKFQLTPVQIERLRIIYPTDRPYGELQVSEFSSLK